MKPGKVSSTAELVAKAAAHRASYEWQCSSDSNVWTNAPVIPRSKVAFVGLALGTNFSFPVRYVTTACEGNWSQVVSLLVG